jgi:hypothetical protein
MRNFRTEICAASLLAATNSVALAQSPSGTAVPVTVDNYNRAQSDAYFGLTIKAGAFGKFVHGRELAPIDRRLIIRPNRDTLYSLAVFDFDAGPVTVTLPDPGKRYMVMQVANEDQYTPAVLYGGGRHTLTREGIGTRYGIVVVRMLVDPANPQDFQQIHALQDALTASQQSSGTFEIPNWDEASLKKVRACCCSLGRRSPTPGACSEPPSIRLIRCVIWSEPHWFGAAFPRRTPSTSRSRRPEMTASPSTSSR